MVDPVELAERFGADALRFYLLDAIPTGRDGEFTLEQLVEHCNTHLANDLGNLASRSVTHGAQVLRRHAGRRLGRRTRFRIRTRARRWTR